jgi:hypothetical protein
VVKACFDAFAHTSRPPETFFSKKIFLKVWSGRKRVLIHLRILLDHQKLFFKKDIFERQPPWDAEPASLAERRRDEDSRRRASANGEG